jgi:hypothetical protein
LLANRDGKVTLSSDTRARSVVGKDEERVLSRNHVGLRQRACRGLDGAIWCQCRVGADDLFTAGQDEVVVGNVRLAS